MRAQDFRAFVAPVAQRGIRAAIAGSLRSDDIGPERNSGLTGAWTSGSPITP